MSKIKICNNKPKGKLIKEKEELRNIKEKKQQILSMENKLFVDAVLHTLNTEFNKKSLLLKEKKLLPWSKKTKII